MAKLIHTIWVNNVVKALKNLYQLSYFIDTVLSNPINYRYRDLYEGKTLLQLFKEMTVNLKDNDIVKVSNGTKTVQFTVKDWINLITLNLDLYNSDEKSSDCNVWINVSNKTQEKTNVKIETLG